MAELDDLVIRIDECIAAARREEALLLAARAALVSPPQQLLSNVVVLPSRQRRGSYRREALASADDVAALVLDGESDAKQIAARLGADGRSVLARLRELAREGLVTETLEGWLAVRDANWAPYRARELASA